ncbi:MAG TPA: ASKHA domain-containing protein, partial [Polyangiaceae bacterium]|nr:ASKHA domain-containing protein [Polyangiaceae bacterium]
MNQKLNLRGALTALVTPFSANGENLDIDNFRSLGFLPDFPDAEYRFMGNTSLAAAERACVDPAFIERCRALRDSLAVVELTSRG